MTDLAIGVQFVVVRERNDPENHAPAQIWIAAVERQAAVDAVRRHVPDTWHVELSDQRPTREQAALSNLLPGDVRQFGVK